MTTLVCLILNLLVRHAGAATTLPARITMDSVLAQMSDLDDVDLNEIKLKHSGPGFLALHGTWGRDFDSAKWLGRLLNDHFGLTLVYLPEIQDVTVPGLSGLVLDRDGRVIANFVSRRTGSHGVGPNVFANTFRKAHDFARIEPWAALGLKAAQRLARGRNADSDLGFVLTTEDQLRDFGRTIRAYRAQAAIFAVGQGRPLWVLIDVVHWNSQWQRHFRGLIPPGSLISRVYLSNSTGLLDLTATCAGALTESANPGHP